MAHGVARAERPRCSKSYLALHRQPTLPGRSAWSPLFEGLPDNPVPVDEGEMGTDPEKEKKEERKLLETAP